MIQQEDVNFNNVDGGVPLTTKTNPLRYLTSTNVNK
jgi:hypothetical protein